MKKSVVYCLAAWAVVGLVSGRGRRRSLQTLRCRGSCGRFIISRLMPSRKGMSARRRSSSFMAGRRRGLPAEAPSFVAAAERLTGAVPMWSRRLPDKANNGEVQADGRRRARWCDSMSRRRATGARRQMTGVRRRCGRHANEFVRCNRPAFAVLGDKAKYPNLRRVVLTGFSAGGQFSAVMRQSARAS